MVNIKSCARVIPFLGHAISMRTAQPSAAVSQGTSRTYVEYKKYSDIMVMSYGIDLDPLHSTHCSPALR